MLDFLDPNAAHHAFDQRDIRIHLRCVAKESLEVVFRSDLLPQAFFGIARQPANDLIDFLPGTLFGLGLPDVHRIQAREFDGENLVLAHGGSPGIWIQRTIPADAVSREKTGAPTVKPEGNASEGSPCLHCRACISLYEMAEKKLKEIRTGGGNQQRSLWIDYR